MIDVKNLYKSYGSVNAVNDISFHIDAGKIVGFLGPNGAGKTTTLRMLTGYLYPDSGEIKINNYDFYTELKQIKSCIGYMPEQLPLYNEMRVIEFLKYRAALKGVSRKDYKKNIKRIIDSCMIEDVYYKIIGTLSKGYKQRVGLADALLNNPHILILDEPTVGLDPNQIVKVRELIKELAKNHTVLISTHILQEVENICDEVLIINNGQIIAQGKTDELVKQIQSDKVIDLTIRTSDVEIRNKLETLPDISEIKIQTTGDISKIELYVKDKEWDIEQLSKLILKSGWLIYRLNVKEWSLEELFLNITQDTNVKVVKEATA